MTNQIPGWSKASCNLRQLPAESLVAPVLICSELGTFFLRRIRQLPAVSKLKQIDLTEAKDSIPLRCILYTENTIGARGLGDLNPFHLDTSKRDLIPEGECSGQSIAAGIVGKFISRLYFPPLRRRHIDVLHWLYALGTGHSSHKLKSDKVSAALIHELIFNSSWMANDESLCQRILALDAETKADKCLRPVQDALIERDYPKYVARKQYNALELNSYKFGKIPKDHAFLATKWECDEDVFIPFDRLPEVAIRIFIWAFFESLPSGLADEEEKTPTFEPLGNPSNWLLPKRMPFRSITTLAISELLSWYAYDLCPKGGWKVSILEKFDRFEFLGTTWYALVDGLNNASDVQLKSYLSTPTKAKKAKPDKSSAIKSDPLPLSKEQKLIAEMLAAGMPPTEVALRKKVSKSYIYKVIKQMKEKATQAGLRPEDLRSRSVRTRGTLHENM